MHATAVSIGKCVASDMYASLWVWRRSLFATLCPTQMLPSLGPMLVAVVATVGNNAVLLYLSLLAGTLVVFSVAFHVAAGSETKNFVSIPKSIMALTEWMIGEIGCVCARVDSCQVAHL